MQSLYRSTTHRFSAGHKILLVILLTAIKAHTINGQRSCHYCEGINCLRTTSNAVEKCSNDFDICATIFDGQTVIAQGCLENLADELRIKCISDDVESMTECHKCNDNLCNNMGASEFKCVQCDSKTDSKCYNNADLMEPVRCPISRTTNQYCFAKMDGDRVLRGCTTTLEEQTSCLASQECIICEPSETGRCNTRKASEEAPSTPTSTTTSSPNSPDTTSPTTFTSTTPKPKPNGSRMISCFALVHYTLLSVMYFIKFY